MAWPRPKGSVLRAGGWTNCSKFYQYVAKVADDRRLQVDERMEDAALRRRRVRVAKKLSTALAQEHEVGVK